MSVITGDGHFEPSSWPSATANCCASGKTEFELLARHPRLSLNLMQILIRRLRNSSRRASAVQPARTIAFVPLHPGIDCRELGGQLQEAFHSIALKAGAVGLGRQPAQ